MIKLKFHTKFRLYTLFWKITEKKSHKGKTEMGRRIEYKCIRGELEGNESERSLNNCIAILEGLCMENTVTILYNSSAAS